MKNYQTIILSNLEISPGYWRMRILAPGFAATAGPGQFVMFRPEQALPTMLRRPFTPAPRAHGSAMRSTEPQSRSIKKS